MVAPVSQYFAKVAIDIDQSSLKKVDNYFKTLESKFKFYSGRLGKGLTMKVNFQANIRDLIRGIQAKLDPKGNGVGVRIRITPRIAQTDIAALRRQLRGGLADIPVTVKYSGNFRQSLMNRINQAIAPARSPAARSSGRGSGGSTQGSNGSGDSSLLSYIPNPTKGFPRRLLAMGTGAIPFVGGAVGVNALNQANTDYQSQKIAAEGIFAGKVVGGGDAARQQLFNLAQLNGFDYKQTLPNFTRFMASAMPSLQYGGAFSSFQALTEFGRARGATSESMERALYAFSQIAGKGKVMSEELFGQLSEAAGFGESGDIFAQAYAMKTKSGLTGQKAQAALREAMKDGKVISSDILPLVAQIMSQRAAPTLEKARGTADANQMRFRNARNEFMSRFSENGGEAGLSKMWQAIGGMMERLAARAPELAQAFESLVDNVVKFAKMFSEISESLWFGYGTGTTIEIQKKTGINLIAIRDTINTVSGYISKFGSMIYSVMESLGFWGTLAVGGGIWGLRKVFGGTAKTVAENAIGGITGTANNLSAYATAGGIRVWVLNPGGGSIPGGVPGVPGAGVPAGGKTPWYKGLGGAFGRASWLGRAGVIGAGAFAGYELYQLGDAFSQLYQAKTREGVSLTAEAQSRLGGADELVQRNISYAGVVADNSAKQMTLAQLNHEVKLSADIKITAENAADSFEQLRTNFESQVFGPLMRGILNEAQSTTSIYAR